MKKKLRLLVVFIALSLPGFADEGMWLPQLLQALNEKQMKKLGMKINASDIYSISKGSLKDAIVSFGGFCTAEVISDKGLILTNHHCGFDAIQNHTSLEKNYIQNGFWAYSFGQELPNRGLTATFIVRIEDVTDQILKETAGISDEKERQSRIDKNLAELRKNYKKESYEDILVRAFFEGNKYFLFVTETYKDVRLVGAPPASIGNFGKDTDNWMWPRHTGDFSLFRIYADKNNKPAAYSPDNVPYTPKRSLNISLKGLKQGDFTMVFGFPGRTNQYLSSEAVRQVMEVSDPAKIAIRAKVLGILNERMRRDEQIKIQYAAKYASVENAYKKWQGEVLGLRSSNALQRKKDYEQNFMQRVNANPAWQSAYGTVLQELTDKYRQIEPYALARDYFTEILPRIELMGVAANLNGLVNAIEKDSTAFTKKKEETLHNLEDLFKEFNAGVDQTLFATLTEKMIKEQPASYLSPLLLERYNNHQQQTGAMAESLYQASSFTSLDKINALLNTSASGAVQAIRNDPAMQLYSSMTKTYGSEVGSKWSELQASINKLQRTYMKAQMEVFSEKTFYPDANSTLRVTYGNVKGYKARDAVTYDYYTYMDGIMEKYKPGDYEFDVPQKLIDLYKRKDYGAYGVNGKMPVCFIASNHTTGGNSGSPALDAYGNLVGLNFDRVWEGTMSDINYNPEICRNIMVDIRYVLFIIDKYAGAQNIISELKLVK